MSPPHHFDLQQASQLATELVGVITPEDGLARVALLARGALPGCDHAGVTVVTGGQLTTHGATDPAVTEVDAAQYKAESGPCVDSAFTHDVIRCDDLLGDPRWPRFTSSAVYVGIRSTLSFPLGSAGSELGSLNCYSGKHSGFGAIDHELGLLLAQQATLLLLGIVRYWESRAEIEQLTEAVQTRQMIGQAVGIIMASRSLGADDAFGYLRTQSQNQNRKLRDVAREVVASVERA